MKNEVKLLNVKLDNVSFDQALDRVKEYLRGDKQNYIVTPNPEIILHANKDEHYRSILNLADLAIPDGIGLKIASLGRIRHRVTGTDLMYAILKHAEEQKLKVYGIIRKGGLSTKEEIMVMMHKRYPLLKYQLRYSGEGEVEKMIDQYKPDIIFVGLGFPDQEKWIAHHLRKFGYVKVFVGIGGAFDFLSEKTTRAPKLIRNSGFEWLWRLIKHPNRIKRIFNAVIIFPLRVLFKKQNG